MCLSHSIKRLLTYLLTCIVIWCMQATEEDYEKVPIEQFGLAVLRGMGWKETDGIGRRGKYVILGDSVSRIHAAIDVF